MLDVLVATVLFSTGAVIPSCKVTDVCQSGYTEMVRPPVDLTNNLKLNLMLKFSASGEAADYELDHFMPLELCGDPGFSQNERGAWVLDHSENLWLEPIAEAREKDKDETRLHREVCKGQISLPDAQAYIVNHWKEHAP